MANSLEEQFRNRVRGTSNKPVPPNAPVQRGHFPTASEDVRNWLRDNVSGTVGDQLGKAAQATLSSLDPTEYGSNAPRSVGYGTILRGPDGGPAIDYVTGQPLTMEELIRRQGIVPWYERVTPNAPATGQTAPVGVRAVPVPSVGGTGVPFPARVPQSPSRPTGGAPVETTPGAPPSLDDAAALADDPEVQRAVAALEPQEQNQFWKMVMSGVGAAAIGAWLANRLTRKGLPKPAAAQQAVTKPISVPIPSAGSSYTGAPASVKPDARIQPAPMAPPKANDMVTEPPDAGLKRAMARKVPPRVRAIRALARARR